MKKNLVRKFLGKLDEFESKEEQKREAKHLKAYLKGDKFYFFGFREFTNPKTQTVGRVPNMFPVLEGNE